MGAPTPRLQGGCWRAPRACALRAAPAAARFPHERWQFAWSYFLDTARPRLRCTRAEPDFEPRAWLPPASPLVFLAPSVSVTAVATDGWLTCLFYVSTNSDMLADASCTFCVTEPISEIKACSLKNTTQIITFFTPPWHINVESQVLFSWWCVFPLSSYSCCVVSVVSR